MVVTLTAAGPCAARFADIRGDGVRHTELGVHASLLEARYAGGAMITHAFLGRRGGVSAGDCASLNCALSEADSSGNILQNRKIAVSALGCGAMPLLLARQCHSRDVIICDRASCVGVDALGGGYVGAGDALVTSVTGVALGVLSADCGPVLACDPDVPVVAAIHAGWRGALAGIVEAAISHMCMLGAKPGSIRAAIGPTIGPDHYEVGPEFSAEFLSQDRQNQRFFYAPRADAAAPGGMRFDLPRYIEARLKNSGIQRVARLDLCTYGAPQQYFSHRFATHRALPACGRQMSLIAITSANANVQERLS